MERELPSPHVGATSRTRSGPLWAPSSTAAGLLGFAATILTDIHVPTDERDAMTTMAMVSQIEQRMAHLSIVTGFISIALLIGMIVAFHKTFATE